MVAQLDKIDPHVAEEVAKLLGGKKEITQKTALLLVLRMTLALIENQNQTVEYLRVQNGRVGMLEKHDIISWMTKNKSASALLLLSFMAVNSAFNWSGFRKPLIQGILAQFGVLVPLDAIP